MYYIQRVENFGSSVVLDRLARRRLSPADIGLELWNHIPGVTADLDHVMDGDERATFTSVHAVPYGHDW